MIDLVKKIELSLKCLYIQIHLSLKKTSAIALQ